MLANHIRKIDVDFVCDRVSIIKGSKDENRSVIISRLLRGIRNIEVSF